MKKMFKVVGAIIIVATIAVVSAYIASNATKKNLDPRGMKCWVEEGFVYLETPDGNVWIHEVE